MINNTANDVRIIAKMFWSIKRVRTTSKAIENEIVRIADGSPSRYITKKKAK